MPDEAMTPEQCPKCGEKRWLAKTPTENIWWWCCGSGQIESKGFEQSMTCKGREETQLKDARIQSLQAVADAAREALEHVLELEDAWIRGAIDERDGKGGTRSNRNVDVRAKLSAALAKLEERTPTGETK